MVGITIYDVKDHHISMDLVREELGNCYEIKQSMELRRARRLEKLSTMSYKKGPRQIFVRGSLTIRGEQDDKAAN